MNRHNYIWKSTVYAVCMTILILDAQTVVSAASEGVSVCLRTVIPSLFPFIVISILLNSSLSGISFRFLRPLARILRIPQGAENILLTGFLGGYPVGAQSISDAWKNGSLSRTQAHRMLGFCSNAGPAFIFGMAGSTFSSPVIPWLLWAIHIISALLVAQSLPGRPSYISTASKSNSVSLTDALEKSIKAMAGICGCVILFRVIIGIADRWILWMLPHFISIGLYGILELANGCIKIGELDSEGLRFIMISLFLGFGGLCVFAQTMSVTNDLGLGYYFPGKILQGAVSILLSLFVQPLLFSGNQIYTPTVPMFLITIMSIIGTYIIISRKKTVAILDNFMYNRDTVL